MTESLEIPKYYLVTAIKFKLLAAWDDNLENMMFWDS
jgi:hypothetical protein